MKQNCKVNSFLVLTLLLLCVNSLFAQANLLNAKKVSDIHKRTESEKNSFDDVPLPYGNVENRDIMWSKITWEYIDMNQKINLPYYYPIDTTNAYDDRRSLFDTAMRSIKRGEITEVYSDSYFISKMTAKEINDKLFAVTEEEFEGEDGEMERAVDTTTMNTADIPGFLIKGVWYFDKRQGEMKYRLLGLAPLGNDIAYEAQMRSEGADVIDSGNAMPLFWIFYPDARESFHKAKVFNPKNSSNPISYDNLLNARRFNGQIIRVENMYGDRKIEDYIKGNALFQLLEADKIKEGIRNREMDMWNY